MAYGVTATGFVPKPLEQILEDLGARQRATVSANLNTDPKTPVGQLNGIFGAELREGWEVTQDVYNAFNPDTNGGVSQDATAAITGTVRKEALRSTLPVRLNLAPGATVPLGAVVARDLGGGVPSTTDRFVALQAVTNAGGVAANFDATFEGEVEGALFAAAGALLIVTPVSGWNTATALADATLGRLDEDDPELRLRREQELHTPGSGTVPGLFAALSQLAGVLSVAVYENDDDVPDADARPPHSVEAVVQGGDDGLIAETIWANKTTGAQLVGTESVDIVDSQGRTRAVNFNRPTPLSVYLAIDVVIGAGFPSDGDAQIKQHLEDWSHEAIRVGGDVVLSKVSAETLRAVAQIEDVVEVRVGIVDPPLGTSNLVTTPRQLAQIAVSRIVVNHVVAP
jgi:uncharacterized phage protein gp47/JayE